MTAVYQSSLRKKLLYKISYNVFSNEIILLKFEIPTLKFHRNSSFNKFYCDLVVTLKITAIVSLKL